LQALESIKASFEIGSVSRFVSAAGPGTHSLLPDSCIIHKKVSLSLARATWFAILYEMYGIHNTAQPARSSARLLQTALPPVPPPGSGFGELALGSWVVGWLGVQSSRFEVQGSMLALGCWMLRRAPKPGAKSGQTWPNPAKCGHAHPSPLPATAAKLSKFPIRCLLVPFGTFWYTLVPSRAVVPSCCRQRPRRSRERQFALIMVAHPQSLTAHEDETMLSCPLRPRRSREREFALIILAGPQSLLRMKMKNASWSATTVR